MTPASKSARGTRADSQQERTTASASGKKARATVSPASSSAVSSASRTSAKKTSKPQASEVKKPRKPRKPASQPLETRVEPVPPTRETTAKRTRVKTPVSVSDLKKQLAAARRDSREKALELEALAARLEQLSSALEFSQAERAEFLGQKTVAVEEAFAAEAKARKLEKKLVELKSVEKQLRDTERRLRDALAKLDSATKLAERLAGANQTALEGVHAAESAQKKAEVGAARDRAAFENLSGSHSDSERELKRLREKVDALSKERDLLYNKQLGALRQVEELKLSQREVAVLRVQAAGAERQAAGLAEELSEASSQLGALASQVETLKALLATSESERRILEAKQITLEKAVSDAKKELEKTARDRGRLQRDLEEATAELASLRDAADNVREDSRGTSAGKLAALEGRITSLSTQLAQSDRRVQELTAQNEAQQHQLARLHNLELQLRIAEEQLATALTENRAFRAGRTRTTLGTLAGEAELPPAEKGKLD